MKYAITYRLGREAKVLVVDADDRDDAYHKARSLLLRIVLISASPQGTARPATQDEIDNAEE